MAEQEKIHIPADVFVILLFADAEQFESIIQKHHWGDFIQQMSMDDFRESSFNKGFYDAKYTYGKKVLVCKNVILDGEIEIVDKTKEEALDWIVFLNSDLGNVHFKKSEIRGETSAFKFVGCTTGSFKIYKSKVGDFEFVNCLTTAKEGRGKIEILESETGYFQFRGCKVGNIRIHRKSETGYFRVEKNSEVDCIELANSSAEYFRIKENSKVGNFTIRNGSKADLFSIEKSEMLDFVFESGVVRILTFNSSDLNKFYLSGNNKFDMFINGSQINWLILKECVLGLETSISISDSDIYYLRMDKFAVIGNLYLRNVKHLAEPVEFEKVGKDEEKKKNGVKKKALKKETDKQKPTFVLFHSSLGKTEFTNCELEGFILKYSNSDLLDTFIVGGTLPTKYIKVIKSVEEDSAPATKEGVEQFDPDSDFIEIDENDPQNPYQKASIFNQLKKVLERGGDTYRSSLLQSEWADNQLKHLSLMRKKKWENIVWCRRGKKYIDQTSQDIYSFWMNKKSNNHDENWGIALLWIVLVSIFFYLWFLCAQGRLFIDTEIDWGLFGNYLEFLNPLHNSNFLNDKIKPEGGIVAIDVVAKLILGFFIYKFLRAFRKYGKK